MVDHDLEQRLAGHFRAQVGDEHASPNLLARVDAIPESTGLATFGGRRGVLMLAAAALLTALLVGAAIAAGAGLIGLPWGAKDAQLLSPPRSGASIRLHGGTRYAAGVWASDTPLVIAFTAPSGVSRWSWSYEGGVEPYQLRLVREGGWVTIGVSNGIYADPCHRLAGTATIEPGAAAQANALRQRLSAVPGIRVDAAPDLLIGGSPTPGLTLTLVDPSRLPACDEGQILLWSDLSDRDGVAFHDSPGTRGFQDGTWDSWWPDSIDLRMVDAHGSVLVIESYADHTDSDAVSGVRSLIESIEWPDPDSIHPTVLAWVKDAPCLMDQVRPTPLSMCYLRPATQYGIALGEQAEVQVDLTVPEPVTYQLVIERDRALVMNRVSAFVIDLVAQRAAPDISVDFPHLGLSCVTGVEIAGGRSAADVTSALAAAIAERPNASVSPASKTVIGGLAAEELHARVDAHSAADFCSQRIPRIVSEEYYVLDLNGRVVVVLAEYDGEATSRPAAISEVLGSIVLK